jgi:integral membrane protein
MTSLTMKRIMSTHGALLRYRTMAYLVGVGLLVLVCVGVPLQYAAGKPAVAEIVGPIHGFLYLVYLVTAYDLWRRERWSILRILAMVAAGFVPGLAFVVERAMTRRFSAEAELAPEDAALPSSP